MTTPSPLPLVPTPALAARPDRAWAAIAARAGARALVVEPPRPDAPLDLPALSAWLAEGLRWQRLGLLPSPPWASPALPGCLARALSLPPAPTPAPPDPGRVPCRACWMADERRCLGLPAGIALAYRGRTAALKADLARLVASQPLARLDAERTALDLGLRQAIRTIGEGDAPPEPLADLATRVVGLPIADEATGFLRPDPGSRRRIRYHGPEPTLLDALVAAETGLLAGTHAPAEVHARLALALGYPACCAEAYARDAQRYVHDTPPAGTNPVHLAAVAARSQAAWAALNPLLRGAPGARLVAHVPCRFDCPAARGPARAVGRALARQSPALAPIFQAWRVGVALLLPDREEAWLAGHLEGPERLALALVRQPGALPLGPLLAATHLELRRDPWRVTLLAHDEALFEDEVRPHALAPGLPRLVAFT